MRWVVLLGLVACAAPPPPKQTMFPTFEPGDTFNTRLADLMSAIWEHGPQMQTKLQAQKDAWPKLSERQMADMISYLDWRAAGGKAYEVHSSLHEAIYRLVELGQNEGPPTQLRKYGEAFEAVKMKVVEVTTNKKG